MKVSKNLVILLNIIPVNGDVSPLMKRGLSFSKIALLIDEAEEKGLVVSDDKCKLSLTKRGEIVSRYYNRRKLPKNIRCKL